MRFKNLMPAVGVGESVLAMSPSGPGCVKTLDLERLFGLLATRAIRPRVAERISFDEVAEAHRRLEAGGRGNEGSSP
jgi:NADPH:quinone reductase